jgi:hypothetical protein
MFFGTRSWKATGSCRTLLFSLLGGDDLYQMAYAAAAQVLE